MNGHAQGYVPKVELRREVAEDLRRIFTAADRLEAEEKLTAFVKKLQEKAPAQATWAWDIVPQGLAVFDLGLTSPGPSPTDP